MGKNIGINSLNKKTKGQENTQKKIHMKMDQQEIISNDNNNNIKIVESSSNFSHAIYHDQVHKGKEIESTKAELVEVMEENRKLKGCVDQIIKDYQVLQSKIEVIYDQKSNRLIDMNTMNNNRNENEEAGLVSLSLGRTLSPDFNKLGANVVTMKRKKNEIEEGKKEKEEEDGRLALTLDRKFEVSEQILSKNSRLDNSLRKENSGNGEEEMERQQAPIKKPRVSVRAKCDTPTMNDGCQWRKYGQKIAKGNPCPRAYYRCTVAPSCPVRKQVQRCVEDMSILITTYEGAHNHPLPISATAMASTTSAASYMFMAGSKTSTDPTTISHPSLNHSTKPHSYYLPNPSIFSNALAHPTITLDLSSKNTILPNYSNQQNDSLNLQTLFRKIDHSTIIPPTNQNSTQDDSIAQAAKALTSDPSFQSVITMALSSFMGGKHQNVN